MGKDVVHHILALSIVVQKYGGQPIHLTVMLSEQLFEFLLICHTLLIHTKIDLLNPLWQFFAKIIILFAKVTGNGTKNLGKAQKLGAEGVGLNSG